MSVTFRAASYSKGTFDAFGYVKYNDSTLIRKFEKNGPKNLAIGG
jgi:hypothetical protein